MNIGAARVNTVWTFLHFWHLTANNAWAGEMLSSLATKAKYSNGSDVFIHFVRLSMGSYAESMVFPVPQIASDERHSLHRFTTNFELFEYLQQKQLHLHFTSRKKKLPSARQWKIIASVFVIRRWYITNEMYLFDIIIMCEWMCAMRWVDVIAVSFSSLMSAGTHCQFRCNCGRYKRESHRRSTTNMAMKMQHRNQFNKTILIITLLTY